MCFMFLCAFTKNKRARHTPCKMICNQLTYQQRKFQLWLLAGENSRSTQRRLNALAKTNNLAVGRDSNSSGLAGSMTNPLALCGPTLPPHVADSPAILVRRVCTDTRRRDGVSDGHTVDTPIDPQEVEVAHKLCISADAFGEFGFETGLGGWCQQQTGHCVQTHCT